MGTLWRGLVVLGMTFALSALVLPGDLVPAQPQQTTLLAASPDSLEYVALGDSYTAGPGLRNERGRPAACRRSARNYPTRVAARLDARLVDVSCGGARREDLDAEQRLRDGSRADLQLNAVSRTTDLVTLGLGANEFGIFARIFGRCARLTAQGRDCGDRRALSRDARRVQGTTTRALRQIQDRAPTARVLVVGYPRMLPAGGRCRLLPFTARDTRRFRAVWARVNLSLRRAAASGGVEYVDPYPVSNRHHLCSRRPWVNGARDRPGKGTAFHPTPAGKAATVRLVLRQVSRGR